MPVATGELSQLAIQYQHSKPLYIKYSHEKSWLKWTEHSYAPAGQKHVQIAAGKVWAAHNCMYNVCVYACNKNERVLLCQCWRPRAAEVCVKMSIKARQQWWLLFIGGNDDCAQEFHTTDSCLCVLPTRVSIKGSCVSKYI